MPKLTKPRKRMELSDKEEDTTPSKKVNSPKKSSQIFDALDDDDDEKVEVPKGKVCSNNNNGSTTKILIGSGLAVTIAVVGFMYVMSGGKKQDDTPPSVVTQQQQQPQQQKPQQQPQQPNKPKEPDTDDRLGIQDFTTNTTMTTDDVLGDGENVTSDLFGLTTRVDYTVGDMYYTTDFVNYTKRRATWGGGLEFYYLDCEYRGSKYMIQVPFKYYKELDDVGIVTVKMEVLRIKGATEDDTRSVVSYMTLDEDVLRTVQKSKTNKKY